MATWLEADLGVYSIPLFRATNSTIFLSESFELPRACISWALNCLCSGDATFRDRCPLVSSFASSRREWMRQNTPVSHLIVAMMVLFRFGFACVGLLPFVFSYRINDYKFMR